MTKASSFAALLLGGLLCGTSALAQTASQIDRAQRLEVQVAALGGSVEVAQIPPGVAADFEVRLQVLERAISELTGKYEESTYQVSQMRDRLEKMNADLDFRFKDSGIQGRRGDERRGHGRRRDAAAEIVQGAGQDRRQAR